MDKTIFILGGTNGVGKSTLKNQYIQAHVPYINADFIARGLTKKQQEGSAIKAVSR